MSSNPKVGDWVSFMNGTVLKIGQVFYVRENKYGGPAMKYLYVTSEGTIDGDRVLEVRGKGDVASEGV